MSQPKLDGVGNGGVFGRALLLRIQPKCFELPTPFRWSIAQPLDVDASRQAALHGSADQLGSKKGQRDGHVDMTDTATHTGGEEFVVLDGVFQTSAGSPADH